MKLTKQDLMVLLDCVDYKEEGERFQAEQQDAQGTIMKHVCNGESPAGHLEEIRKILEETKVNRDRKFLPRREQFIMLRAKLLQCKDELEAEAFLNSVGGEEKK